MAIIIGIDPGSRITGFGVINFEKGSLRHIANGSLKIKSTEVAVKLKEIFSGISEVIAEFKPESAAIEQVFVHRNVDSALKLGQARGAALVALANYSLPVFEYAPRAIKQAITGFGSSDKYQIQQMIKILLKLKEVPEPDAADALAIAICHAHTRRL